MVKISYRDLSPGVYAQAESDGRRTIIYMVPGLGPAQRRAALRRLRHNARMGHGPGLPLPALALAVAVDRIRTTAGNCAAVVRVHPAGTAFPVMALSAATVVYVLMSSVSVHVLRAPQTTGRSQGSGQGQAAFPFPSPTVGKGNSPSAPGSPGTSGPSRLPGSQRDGTPGYAGVSGGLTARRQPTAVSGAVPSALGSGRPASRAVPAGTASSAPQVPSPSSSPVPSASIAISAGDPSPSSSPASSSKNDGVCVNLGSFRVCFGLS